MTLLGLLGLALVGLSACGSDSELERLAMRSEERRVGKECLL